MDYWDLTLASFACRVSQGGAKTFILKTYNSRRAIGRWPLISLAAARREAKRILAEKTLGRIQPQSITVAKACELFLKEKEKARRARTVQDLKDRLDRHFDIPGQLGKITHNQIVRRLEAIKTPQEFNAALRVGRTFFTWCTNRRYITENPTTGIDRRSVPSRTRVVSNKPGRHRLTRAKPEHTSKGASPIDAVYGATTHISGDSFPRSKPKAWSSKSSSSSSASPTDGTRRGNIWSFAYQTCILLVLQRRLTPCN
ncbi:Arm DNA-binding domain-containing protein [Bradyrhizobium diazoefficiens]|uniref:Arm DNA-binding domain-containing protein n=1 Tax=Bradyrhizobium diazoefficiens TaxID=1355477 RepID=UPI00272D8BC6|nr:Arm DNA-binding domain-containing protein [Bradyrhizobium diazoefficiens]WLA65082.1 Arm DNA-binding domain-containing protein [Bradyrhizobium diazoefficiens]